MKALVCLVGFLLTADLIHPGEAVWRNARVERQVESTITTTATPIETTTTTTTTPMQGEINIQAEPGEAEKAATEPGEAEKATARKNDRSAATERENAERGHHLREENIGPNDPDTSSHSADKKLQAIAVDGNTERQSGSYGEVLKARYCYWGEPCKKSNEGKLWSHGCYKGYCWTQCSALGMIGEWCWSSIYYKHDVLRNYLRCKTNEDCTKLEAYKRGCAGPCSVTTAWVIGEI